MGITAKKYEFTGEIRSSYSGTLKRIKLLRDCGSFKQGTIGGWLLNESNLSHDGDCFVAMQAVVTDDAFVSENAVITGCAEVYGNAKIMGQAWISENARIGQNAQIAGTSHVRGRAYIINNAQVINADVDGIAQVLGNVIITGADQVCTMQSAHQYSITALPENVVLGHTLYSYDECQALTLNDVIDMQMDQTDLDIYKDVIKAFQKLIKHRMSK